MEFNTDRYQSIFLIDAGHFNMSSESLNDMYVFQQEPFQIKFRDIFHLAFSQW